jgi:hypothetical protein
MPPQQGNTVYIGDYQQLVTIGSTFYGTFSASNKPDPNNFPRKAFFQRNFKQRSLIYQNNFVTDRNATLVDLAGVPTPVSIDPFFFSGIALGV